MDVTPDQIIYFEYGFIKINNTIVTTWIIMACLTLMSYLITRRLNKGLKRSRGQNALEIIVLGTVSQIRETGLNQPIKYLAFIGTLFMFLAVSCLGTLLPIYIPPTSSLSTTAALAICVFIAVPLYGIRTMGVKAYLKTYLEPTVIMLPFNIIGELTRTLALAVRLFGNMMSGAMIIAVLLTIAPLLFPIFMTVLGLLTGMVQAYIFSILTCVYIAAAIQDTETKHE